MMINILAGLLFALALYCAYSALNLVPTDLGFAWMNGAFIFLAASMVVLAVRFAGARIEKRLQTLQAGLTAVMAAGLTGGSEDDRPALRPDPVIAAPGELPGEAGIPQQPMVADAPSGDAKRPGAAILAGAGALAAGGTLLAAGAAMASTAEETVMRTDADSGRDVALEVPVATAEAVEPDVIPAPAAEMPLDTAPVDAATPVTPPAMLSPEDSFIAELERDIFAEFPVLRGEAPGTATLAMADEPDADILVAPSDETAAAGNAADDIPAADLAAAPADAGTSPPTAPQPGLIADEDLAALETSEPPLAPLDTLEIVGAYDSGGTRFTMYSDGSVTASGSTIDRRFSSLDALRAFIDGGADS